MGLFDSVRTFFGGHGVSVGVLDVHGQGGHRIRLGLGEDSLAGTFEVSTTRPAEILGHQVQLLARRKVGESTRSVTLVKANLDPDSGSSVSGPYSLAPGQTVSDAFRIRGIDLTRALAELEADDLDTVLDDPTFAVALYVYADVKGSPLDAVAEIPVDLQAEPAVPPAAPVAAQPLAVVWRMIDTLFVNEASLYLHKERIEPVLVVTAGVPTTLVRQGAMLEVSVDGRPPRAVASVEVPIEVVVHGDHEVTLELPLDLRTALSDLELSARDVVQVPSVVWTLRASVSTDDGEVIEVSQVLPLDRVRDERLSGEGYGGPAPGPAGHPVRYEVESGDGQRTGEITSVRVEVELDDDGQPTGHARWVFTPEDGLGDIVLTLPDRLDTHYTEGDDTPATVFEHSDGCSVEAGYPYRGWVYVTYHVGTTLRGYVDGRFDFLGDTKGRLRGDFELEVPEALAAR